MSATDQILVGIIGAAHGVRGELRLKSFTGDPAAIGDYGPLNDAAGRKYKINHIRPIKDDMLVVRFEGVADRNAAEKLTNTKLFLNRALLPETDEEEFYHADLIGLACVTEAGDVIGKVTSVQNFGAGDLLEIAPPAGESLLLPFTRAVVPVVDIKAGKLTVVPPVVTEGEPEAEPS